LAGLAGRGSTRALSVTTGLAAYLLYNAVMFAFATPFNRAFLFYELWLSQVLPALFDERPADVLDSSGLTTNPVFVQDLAFWLPLVAWLGLLVWRAHPAGVAAAAAGATFWVAEAVSVALDQWLGHHADPTSVWASAGAVPMFAVLAVVGVVPLVVLLRSLPTSG
jgi:hypothetical protein